MPNVVRFTMPTAVNLDVPGVGTFIGGVLDIDANNLEAVNRARFRLYPFHAVEVGIVDAATPKPSLPAVPGPALPDPYPQYVTDQDIGNPASAPMVALRAAFVPTTALNGADSVSVWGDSLVASAGVDWPGTTLAAALGIPVYNGGRAGWASSDIAIRQGGLQPALTVTGNQIPAGGPVTVTAISPASSYRSDNAAATYTWAGSLAGVPGTLARDGANVWTFTRTSAGTATACPAGTPFIGTDGDPYRYDVQILWAGRNNNIASAVSLNDVVRDHDRMVRNLARTDKRYLVLGVTNTSAETKGTQNYNAIVALNAQLAQRFGDRFFDVRTWLIQHGLAAAHITPTAQDTTDIANDIIPSSLRSDATHPNGAGYTAIGQAVADEIAKRGWVVGVTPNFVNEYVTLISDTFTGTDGAAFDPAKWAVTTTNGSATIQGNRGRLRTGATGGFAVADRVYAMSTASNTTVDVELLFSVEYGSVGTESYLFAAARANQNDVQAAGSNAYMVAVGPPTIDLYKRVAGTKTTLFSASYATLGLTSPVNGAKKWVRFRVEGSTLQYRAWDDGKTEPGWWAATITDTSITGGGMVGLNYSGGNAAAAGTMYVDDLQFRAI